jgi:hypothetical protein
MFLATSASGAQAGCGDAFKAKRPVFSWMHDDKSESKEPPTIFGLRHVNYTAADGSPFKTAARAALSSPALAWSKLSKSGVHDKKVMSHAALCSVLRSQKS